MNADHYTYRVFWSPEDREYVGECVEFSSLSHLDKTPGLAFRGIRALVGAVTAELARNREPAPKPRLKNNFC